MLERCGGALCKGAVVERCVGGVGGTVASSTRTSTGRREVEIGPRRAAVGRQTRKDEHEVGFSMMHGW